jgi:hypothetical protein
MPLNSRPPDGVLIAATESEHRFYRLCAEWELFPHARKAIKQQIYDHPHWGIEIVPNERLSLKPQTILTVVAETVEEIPHRKVLKNANPS